MVDGNGAVTMTDAADDTKDTAQSHSPSTPPLSKTLGHLLTHSKVSRTVLASLRRMTMSRPC